MKTNLKQLSKEELTLFIERLGHTPYRVGQIIRWIYKNLATTFDEMTDLPKNLREELNKIAFISNVNLIQQRSSKDGTQKFFFELEDGEAIESVLIHDKGRLTLCTSSQVGCAMGCKFCGTGRIGLRRNLKAYEIVDQVIAVRRLLRDEADAKSERSVPSITNIVLMGMGEPLHNFDELIRALWKITDLMGFSKRRITLSTAGIIPKISELAVKSPGINLAISLNATTDEVRDKIMPINKRYPLKKLIAVCKEFSLPPRRRITFEYVLLDRINDSKEDASRLITLLKGIKSKVNLIPYNPINDKQQEIQFKKPPDDKVVEFQKILLKAGITAIIRKSKGMDISAACGQLRASYLS